MTPTIDPKLIGRVGRSLTLAWWYTRACYGTLAALMACFLGAGVANVSGYSGLAAELFLVAMCSTCGFIGVGLVGYLWVSLHQMGIQDLVAEETTCPCANAACSSQVYYDVFDETYHHVNGEEHCRSDLATSAAPAY